MTAMTAVPVRAAVAAGEAGAAVTAVTIVAIVTAVAIVAIVTAEAAATALKGLYRQFFGTPLTYGCLIAVFVDDVIHARDCFTLVIHSVFLWRPEVAGQVIVHGLIISGNSLLTIANALSFSAVSTSSHIPQSHGP